MGSKHLVELQVPHFITGERERAAFKGPSHLEPFCDATKGDFPHRIAGFVPSTVLSSAALRGRAVQRLPRPHGGRRSPGSAAGPALLRSRPALGLGHSCDERRAQNSGTQG